MYTSHQCKPDRKWTRPKNTSVPSKPWKTQRDAGWDGASLGWVKQRTQYCQYASWQTLSKPRSGKGTQTNSGVSTRHSCQKTWEALSRMASRQNRVRDQASHLRKQQTARPHSVCTLMAQSPKTSEGRTSLSSKVRLPSMKTVHPIRSQPPAWQWRWKQSPMPSAASTTHAMIVPDSMSLRQKVKNEMGSPDWNVSMVKIHLRKLCGCTTLNMPKWMETTEQIDWWAKQPSQVACSGVVWKLWNVEKFETWPVGTKPRISHHWSPGGEGLKKEALEIFPEKNEKGPLRQSDEHWNRFKGNAGEPVRDGVERILTLYSA